ncbi:MAG: Hsp70 family protein [Burkholderiaceae bacterium]|nr:Hsp70 family protein [Burkholderiaceae bacterium]
MLEIILVLLFVSGSLAIISVRRIKADMRLVIFRVGKFSRIARPGFSFPVPFLESGVLVNVKEIVPEYYEGFPEQLLEERIKTYVLHGGSPASSENKAMVQVDPELQALVEWLTAEAISQTGVPLQKDEMAMQRISEAAIAAREALTKVDRHSISLPYLTVNASGPKHFVIELSKEELISIEKNGSSA